MSETDHQIAIVEWAAWKSTQDPRYDYLIHIPNQGKRSLSQGRLFKRMGLRKGFPDLAFLYPNRGRCLFIEMKLPGQKPTKEQTEWHERLHSAGHVVRIAYSSNEAIEMIEGHLSERALCPLCDRPLPSEGKAILVASSPTEGRGGQVIKQWCDECFEFIRGDRGHLEKV